MRNYDLWALLRTHYYFEFHCALSITSSNTCDISGIDPTSVSKRLDASIMRLYFITSKTGYGLRDRWIGVWFPAKAKHYSLLRSVQTGCSAHPASYPMGIADCFLEGKAQGREADHSYPSCKLIMVVLYLTHPFLFLERYLINWT